MPIVTVRPSASGTGPTDDLPRRVSEAVFEVGVDGDVVEAAGEVGAVAAEVELVAEFVVGDAGFEGAEGGWGGGLDAAVDAVVGSVLGRRAC